MTEHDLPPQVRDTDTILERFGDWALLQSQGGGRFVSHVGRPQDWPVIEYDIEFERLDENWTRQLGEKSWMSDQSKADLEMALQAARATVKAEGR